MTSDKTNLDLSIRINGNAVPEYHHEGRVYVEAREGTQFALHIKNRNPFRAKVVLTVDGVSVLSGEPSEGKKDETGYIIDAEDSITIAGYRLSDSEVAAFKFVKAEGGYATKEKGMIGTTGVIGLKAWQEQEAPVPAPAPVIIKEIHHHDANWYPWWSYCGPYRWNPPYWFSVAGNVSTTTLTANAQSEGTMGGAIGGTLSDAIGTNSTYTCSLNAAPIVQSSMQCAAQLDSAPVGSATDNAALAANPWDMGATFGAKLESKVTEVVFKVGVLLGEMALYFASRAGLQSMGIDLTRTQKVTLPEAFPGKWAKPPSGWTG